METLVILLHIVTACALVAFVLLQQGKGAEAGASFGAGASQTLFGSVGSWNFFSRVTAGLALVFFLTSFGLAVIAKHNAGAGAALTPEIKMLEAAPADTEIPTPGAGDSHAADAEIPAIMDEAASKDAATDDTVSKDVVPRDATPKP
ncbi:MAG: preprotein translocase subunit SecG [Porticoccaceae bacterium]